MLLCLPYNRYKLSTTTLYLELHSRKILSAYAHLLQTHKHLRLVMTLIALGPQVGALGKAKPLISTAARQKFDLDL